VVIERDAPNVEDGRDLPGDGRKQRVCRRAFRHERRDAPQRRLLFGDD
jgi:hypothetical protein